MKLTTTLLILITLLLSGLSYGQTVKSREFLGFLPTAPKCYRIGQRTDYGDRRL